MDLTISRPEGEKHYKIIWIELNTPVGNFIIAKGHAPMILTLLPEKQLTYLLENGKEHSELIPGGIAHVTRQTVNIILNAC